MLKVLLIITIMVIIIMIGAIIYYVIKRTIREKKFNEIMRKKYPDWDKYKERIG